MRASTSCNNVPPTSLPTAGLYLCTGTLLLRAPLHLKADLKVKLNFHRLDLIFRSIRVQIRIPCGQNRHIQASLILKLAVFRLLCVHVHGGACLNNENVVTSAQVVKKRALFFRALVYSDRVSRATMAFPWATRIAACSSRSPLSRTRKNIFTTAVQVLKNAGLQQANASVCGRKISLDPLS
jgi:hypothetical protein